MMYMQVMFRSWNWKKRDVIRTEVVELPDWIKNKGLDLIRFCEEKAKSLCRKGERVSGWKLLKEYELEMLKKRRGYYYG